MWNILKVLVEVWLFMLLMGLFFICEWLFVGWKYDEYDICIFFVGIFVGYCCLDLNGVL